MRNYIILNGNNSNEITGLLIQSLPPISKPLMRTAIEEIDGRDGDIVTTLGYSAYDKEVSIGLYGSYDVDEVIKYFNDNSKGQVTFSNEPNKYYNYEIINQIDFERLIRFKTATVTLHCQPFKYPTEETPVEIEIQNITNEAEEMDLDNTADAPMEIDLKGNTQQDSEPSPSSPQDIHVVSGDNTIEICGKNLFDKSNTNVINGFINASSVIKSGSNDKIIYIPCKANTTYSVQKMLQVTTSKNRFSLGTTEAIPTLETLVSQCYKAGDGTTTTSYTITTNSVAKYLVFFCYSNDTETTFNEMLNSIQIEISDEPTTHEAYTKQSQLISLGVENLVNVNDTTITSSTNLAVIDTSNINGSITLSVDYNNTSNVNGVIRFTNGSSTNYGTVVATANTSGNLTMTLDVSSYNSVTLVAQGVSSGYSYSISNVAVNKGTTPQHISNIPIELCKIGDYQDYIYKDSGKWYLHKEIGKVDFSTINSFNRAGTWNNPTAFYANNVINHGYSDYGNIAELFSNRFTSEQPALIVSNASNTGKVGLGANSNVFFSISGITTSEDYVSYFQSNPTYLYCRLATPTDTEITDTTLLEQLENIANARSYDTSTHITQNANDKPFILNATAIQKGSDTGIVDNDGNIYSKPTLDIEGTGTVAIYLNGNQMFSVDLSNSDECVIDVTNLEAYDPTTDDLMNRQVTGDYSNFTLPVGENTVKVSGNVTKATISGYTRWL